MSGRLLPRLPAPPEPDEASDIPVAASAHPVALVPVLPAPPFTRPLALRANRAFAAGWTNIRRPGPGFSLGPPRPRLPVRELLFVRDDGYLLVDPPPPLLSAARPPSKLWDHPLASAPPFPAALLWSDAALQRYLAGQRPAPAQVFHSLVAVLQHFIDFTGSLAADPAHTAEFLATYILATWLSPAFA